MSRKRLVRHLASAAIAAGAVTAAALASGAPPHQAAFVAPRHGLGLIPDAPRPVSAAVAHAVRAAAPVPASVNLTALAPPVGDQGAVNSCAAWSSDYTALGYWLRHDNRASDYLAPMYTYSQVDGGADNGSSIDGNLQIAQTQGVDIRSHYTQGSFDWRDRPTAAEQANAANWKLSSYQVLPVAAHSTLTQLSIEQALAAGTPVVVAIPVYANFEALGPVGHGLYTAPAGALLGGHAVTALGYDSTGLRVENSWSTGWGDSGFATLSWSFVNNYVFEAVAVGDLVANTHPPIRPTVATLSPTTGSSVGSTRVRLTGTNLTSAQVTVGGRAVHPVAASATSITFLTPAHSAGATLVTVATTGGSASARYTYVAKPAVSRVSPSGGPTRGGTRITLTGSGLAGAAVHIAGLSARVLASSAGSLTFLAPSHSSGWAGIAVFTAGGQADNRYNYQH